MRDGGRVPRGLLGAAASYNEERNEACSAAAAVA